MLNFITNRAPILLFLLLHMQMTFAQQPKPDSFNIVLPMRGDSITMAKEMERNGAVINEIMRENNKKKKNAAYVRIGIGAGFLVILLIGLSRRRKKVVNTK